ncbi:hypothetical protein AAG570_006310 [Ranatra chinensis]|uniref:Uncharacterized protein n=1 Tax=Ranatra chinensis TaxID=642074 RepID=A0ABD0YVS4_9HEMI
MWIKGQLSLEERKSRMKLRAPLIDVALFVDRFYKWIFDQHILESCDLGWLDHKPRHLRRKCEVARSCGTLSGTPCQQIELHPVAQPYQYTAVTQSSDSITHSYATRSNHSFSSKHSSHVYCNPQIPRIPCVRLKPDLSQMERLATL